jgi:threonyl-tRNA synthetase
MRIGAGGVKECDLFSRFVIGKRDLEADAVSVRVHGKGNLGAKAKNEAIADILLSIKERQT